MTIRYFLNISLFVIDLHAWMTEEAIVQHYNTFKAHNITGSVLLEFKALYLGADPISTVKYIFDEKMKISSVGEIFTITAALRRL